MVEEYPPLSVLDVESTPATVDCDIETIEEVLSLTKSPAPNLVADVAWVYAMLAMKRCALTTPRISDATLTMAKSLATRRERWAVRALAPEIGRLSDHILAAHRPAHTSAGLRLSSATG